LVAQAREVRPKDGLRGTAIETVLYEIGYLDTLSLRDGPLQRLDPRVKVLTTMAFILTVVSFGKYEISRLLPMLLYPIFLMAAGDLPSRRLMKRVLIVSPFAIMIGVFNPLFDREVLVHLGPMGVSGGWISFASILLRFCLTVSAAMILVAVTGFTGICMALERIRVPGVFVVQLLFLYRYIFVLMEEAARMARARSLRSFSGRGKSMRVFGSLAGQLLLRTIDRAERVHLSMVCKGFDGRIRLLRTFRVRRGDAGFFLGWILFFALVRCCNLPLLLGELLTGRVS
jgi:cobalt/nickel transport system permease protein